MSQSNWSLYPDMPECKCIAHESRLQSKHHQRDCPQWAFLVRKERPDTYESCAGADRE
jgi:hypothetical protein